MCWHCLVLVLSARRAACTLPLTACGWQLAAWIWLLVDDSMCCVGNVPCWFSACDLRLAPCGWRLVAGCSRAGAAGIHFRKRSASDFTDVFSGSASLTSTVSVGYGGYTTVCHWGTDEEAGGSGDTVPSSRRPQHEQLRERGGRGLIATPSRIEVRRHPVPRRSTGRSVIGSTRCSWSMPVIS